MPKERKRGEKAFNPGPSLYRSEFRPSALPKVIKQLSGCKKRMSKNLQDGSVTIIVYGIECNSLACILMLQLHRSCPFNHGDFSFQGAILQGHFEEYIRQST